MGHGGSDASGDRERGEASALAKKEEQLAKR